MNSYVSLNDLAVELELTVQELALVAESILIYPRQYITSDAGNRLTSHIAGKTLENIESHKLTTEITSQQAEIDKLLEMNNQLITSVEKQTKTINHQNTIIEGYINERQLFTPTC